MAEAVRLVIWDLDDTFWKGTIAEGGLEAYLDRNHDTVIELAKRGIISSICSKNDFAAAAEVLRAHGIFDHFVFPSIDWTPKPQRVADIIAKCNLRPASVMFIDDNKLNLAGAKEAVPDLQIEDETFPERLLDDPRFTGGADPEMTRLKQYKLLEAKQHDQEAAAGDSEQFLRNADIRVMLEFDVEANIDRAVELINRTNQLNYTKRRLPENLDEAKAVLRAEMATFNMQAGLVRVVDRYGDYGLVGFFLLNNLVTRDARGRPMRQLVHYCFSCRTLGMYVERWLYDYLERPRLAVVGPVVVDLGEERSIDWIRVVGSIDDADRRNDRLAEEIRFVGGCETDALATYFRQRTGDISIACNFNYGVLFSRLNSVYALFSAMGRDNDLFRREMRRLNLPWDLMVFDSFARVKPDTVFIFNGGADARPEQFHRYVHKTFGWEILIEPMAVLDVDLVRDDFETIAAKVAGRPNGEVPAYQAAVADVARQMKANWVRVIRRDLDDLAAKMTALFEAIPEGAKLILLLDDPRARGEDGRLVRSSNVETYNATMRRIAAPFAHVGVVAFSDSIVDEREIHVGGNHVDRRVYLRVADRIAETIAGLSPKSV